MIEPDYRAMVERTVARNRANRRPILPLTARGWILVWIIAFWAGVVALVTH